MFIVDIACFVLVLLPLLSLLVSAVVGQSIAELLPKIRTLCSYRRASAIWIEILIGITIVLPTHHAVGDVAEAQSMGKAPYQGELYLELGQI